MRRLQSTISLSARVPQTNAFLLGQGHQKGIGEIVSCEEASGKVVSYIMSAKATDPFLNGDSWGAPRFQAASTGFRWEALVNGPIVH